MREHNVALPLAPIPQHNTVPDPPAHGAQFPTRPITLLGVWAHPDDESYLSAVLMSRVLRVGGRVVLATATRGEAGGSGDPGELARLREHELRAAMAELCVRDVRFLGYGDGECAYADAEAAIESIIALIEDVRPDVIVTFGPDGVTGHPDHIAVSMWTTAAAAAVGHERVLYATMTTEFMRRHDSLHSDLGVWMGGEPQGVDASDLALHVAPTTRERMLKARALRAHASQTSTLIDMIGDEAFDDWWVDEFYRSPTAQEWEIAASRRTSWLVS